VFFLEAHKYVYTMHEKGTDEYNCRRAAITEVVSRYGAATKLSRSTLKESFAHLLFALW